MRVYKAIRVLLIAMLLAVPAVVAMPDRAIAAQSNCGSWCETETFFFTYYCDAVQYATVCVRHPWNPYICDNYGAGPCPDQDAAFVGADGALLGFVGGEFAASERDCLGRLTVLSLDQHEIVQHRAESSRFVL